MKICVYAIAKNEKKFIERWYNSVKEADYICVLDTGSTDGSQDVFKNLGIIFQEKNYKTFRFDTARNDSMKLIPSDTDMCVCVDLDEVFETGWTTIIKQNWNHSIDQIRYRYTWNFNADGSEGVVFFADKIHKHKLFKWTNPVHEILTPLNNLQPNIITFDNIQLNHHADNSKSRSSYLPLLELSVKENPNNDRNVHYLGREYMFCKQYDKAIKTLKKHLSLPTSTWKTERSASYRYIANCYKEKHDIINQERHLMKAIIEDNSIREPYYDLALMYFENKDYIKAIFTFNEMFKIKKRELNYMSSPVCWDYSSFDYLSLCYYEIKDYLNAILSVQKALSLSPKNKRLKHNLNCFIELFNKHS